MAGVNSHLTLSLSGQLFLKNQEKLYSTSPTQKILVTNPDTYTGDIYSYYDNLERRWAIGWGYTVGVYKGMSIGIRQAEDFLRQDIRQAESSVKSYITIPLNQIQFDSLVSLLFDLGPSILLTTKLRGLINKGQWREVYNTWVRLQPTGRRRQEAEKFISASGSDKTTLDIEIPNARHIVEKVVASQIVKDQYFIYQHQGSTLTVSQLLESPEFVLNSTLISKKELLSISYSNKTNHERLFDNLTQMQKALYSKEEVTSLSQVILYDDETDYPITFGCELIIPNSKVEIGIQFRSNLVTENNQFSNYFPSILKVISTDPGYIQQYGEERDLVLRSQHAVASVFCWSRTLHLQEADQGYFDLSKYILSVTFTNSTSGGTNFTLNLPPIQGEVVDGRWVPSLVSEQNLMIALGKLNQQGRNQRLRKELFFKQILQENDLVFISLEKLVIEEDKKSIPNNWYDMIGMVDSVQVSTGSNNEINILVSGRSLSKALLNDNTYFNPYSVGHASSIYGDSPLANERFLDGRFYNLDSILSRTIQQSVEFIFHRISTIGYVPNDIFTGFENLTKTSSTSVQVQEGPSTELLKNVWVDKKIEVKGVWQLIKVFIDQSVRDFVIVDDSISNPNGSVFDLLKKICQEEFVELFTDTYGDKFYIVIRKLPFDRDTLLDALVATDIPEEFQKYSNTSISSEQRRLAGTELVTKSEEGYRIQDVSIDEPLFPRVITIGEDIVLQEELDFSPRSYSWFQLKDMGNYAGQSVGLGLYPGVYFEQMANTFGNSMLSVVSNYSNQDFWSDSREESRLDYYAKHASQLLGWLVETNIHLPFTREGTITIQGDRRIKVGMFIYYKPTNEIFYVKAVTNSLSMSSVVDRTTQITVERGMVRQYIKGVYNAEDDTVYSYFDLVDIEKFKEEYYKVVTQDSSQGEKFDYKRGIQMNPKVFDFFLRKKQFQ